jgi:4'-phosphopantetheinyl transferase
LRIDPRQHCLTSDELARAARFVTEDLRRRFRNGRTLLRLVLSLYSGAPPQSLTFLTSPYGKPRLHAGLQRGWCFNASHSGECFVCAVSRDHRRIGVDVEVPRPLPDALKISERFFSPAERAELAAYSGIEQQAAFFRCWTRKEAVIKAPGFGLRLPLDSFDVSLEPAPPGNLLKGARARSLARRDWRLVDATRDGGPPCAVAADGPIAGIRHCDWETG